jgi:peptidoglycan/LPS O-acetylase OafA/YrhL
MNGVLPISLVPPDDDNLRAGDNRLFIILIVVMMILAWLLGVLVLQGAFSPRSAFGWMAFLCLLASGWYGYGFVRENSDKDPGLVLSAAGWLLAALAAFVQFLTSGPDTNPATAVFGWLAALLILAGAAWSLARWWQNVRAVSAADDDDLSAALRSAGQK